MPYSDQARDGLQVVLVGDHETTQHLDELIEVANQHGVTVDDVFSFEPGEPAMHEELTDVDALVRASGKAISSGIAIWVPYPREDLCREQHFRRLSLVLQRHGLNLLFGSDLSPCPITEGWSQADSELRAEVRAVDKLDRFAIATAGAPILYEEIRQALTSARDGSVSDGGSSRGGPTGADCEYSPPPVLPAVNAPWPQRKPILRRYAIWLSFTCGLSRQATAQCLNAAGHRTSRGRQWRRGTVSTLIKGDSYRKARQPPRRVRRRLR